MSHAERFPHPGPMPPRPGPQPAAVAPDGRIALSEMTAWQAELRAFNDWIKAHRKAQVARALDALQARTENLELEPAEVIAFVVGVAFLEGSGTFAPGLLGGLATL